LPVLSDTLLLVEVIMHRAGILLYCLLTCATSWAIQILAIHVTGNPSSPEAGIYLATAMLTPTLFAILFILFSKPARKDVLWKPTRKLLVYLPIGILVPILWAFATVAIVHVTGWGSSGWFAFSPAGVKVSGGPWLLGTGSQGWAIFAVNVVLTGAAYALFNGVVAAGEEFGWRGFLQGKMITAFGLNKGIMLLGLVWSIWHLPALLAGYNFPEYPLLGALVLTPIQLVANSFFLGWLTIRSGSFWAAAVAHGAGNSIQEGVVANIHLLEPRIYLDVTRLLLEVSIGLLCWWSLNNRSRRGAPENPHSNAALTAIG
jgi:membrane protease YdiL (CAAX protease family)